MKIYKRDLELKDIKMFLRYAHLAPRYEIKAVWYIICILKPFTLVVGVAGFEPTTSWTPFKRASQAALHPDEFCNYSIFLSIINLNPKLKYFDIDFVF